MKRIIIIAVSAIVSGQIAAQKIDNVLVEIEANNPSLKALRESVDAEKIEAHTGIGLSDPEVGFNYLWGSPQEAEENRYDISLSQSFDFPTAYYYRKKLADGKANEAELRYLSERRGLFQNAVEICVNLAYCQALDTMLQRQFSIVEHAKIATEKSYQAGQCNIVDLNKARVDYLKANKELEYNKIDIEQLRSELYLLNGGKQLDNEVFTLEYMPLLTDFESWYERVVVACPELLIARQGVENALIGNKLQRSQCAPHFSLGYMSERTKETTLQGVSFSVNIPVFERRNTVKASKAKQIAAEANMVSTELKLKQTLMAAFDKAKMMSDIVRKTESDLDSNNGIDSLLKALETGQISIFVYSEEIRNLYDLQKEMLDIRKEAAHLYENLRIFEK